MDTTFLDDPDVTFVEFEFDGVKIRFFEGPEIRSIENKYDYVYGRIARSNGLRIGDRDFTVEFAPSYFEGHDTFISSGLDIGRGVVVHARTSIGKGVKLGTDVEIGFGCTIGDHVQILGGTKIGDENFIPDLTEFDAGVVVPPRTFSPLRRDLISPAMRITQDFVDRVARGNASAGRSFD